MKQVKKLSVTVTYKVGYGDLEMPENVYHQICEASENGHEIENGGIAYAEAAEWVAMNIEERDCFECKTEIDEIK